jgi:UDP-N-acetylglucosamine pyrophosphorylase
VTNINPNKMENNEQEKTGLQIASEVMSEQGIPDIVIKNFLRLYSEVIAGKTGFIREQEIDPVQNISKYDEIKEYELLGKNNLKKLVVIKLNGGLGTSMGLEKAKSLLKVKNNLSFLDIIAKQTELIKTPLIFMNSFHTEKDTIDALKKYPNLNTKMFLQFKHPKISATSLLPFFEGEESWNPPGHGDIYPALVSSGVLDELIKQGYKYIFISNIDNLGAIADPSILGFIVKNNIPFLMEVCTRQESDNKGGHIAKRNNSLILREVAQCHPEDELHFQNIQIHKYFNTNSIWLNLDELKNMLQKNENILELPLIRNKKINGAKEVYQIETAMGAAINLFEKAEVLEVPRSRFLPVKKCSDLLITRSDIYELDNQYNIKAKKSTDTLISLDEKFYKSVSDFEVRFKELPSLIKCASLKVKGDVLFSKNNVFEGNVEIENKTNKQIIMENKHLRDEKLIFQD